MNAKGISLPQFKVFNFYSFQRSFCSEHAWQTQNFDPSKHSIFSLEEELAEDEEAAYSQLQVKDGGPDQNVQVPSHPMLPPALSPERSSGHHKSKKTLSMKLGRSFIICEGNAGHL